LYRVCCWAIRMIVLHKMMSYQAVALGRDTPRQI
jgi:hypothetical protein